MWHVFACLLVSTGTAVSETAVRSIPPVVSVHLVSFVNWDINDVCVLQCHTLKFHYYSTPCSCSCLWIVFFFTPTYSFFYGRQKTECLAQRHSHPIIRNNANALEDATVTVFLKDYMDSCTQKNSKKKKKNWHSECELRCAAAFPFDCLRLLSSELTSAPGGRWRNCNKLRMRQTLTAVQSWYKTY